MREKIRYVCRQCGKVFKGRKDRKRKFCSFSCYNKTRTITLSCTICKKEFTIPKHDKTKKYCSAECRSLYFKSKKVIIVCEFCGKEVSVKKCKGSRKFCSIKCRVEGLRDPSKRGVFVCEWCNNEFENWTRKLNRYCSRECAGAGMRRERHPNWRGGTGGNTDYGSNWVAQKRKAKNRDNHTCQACGYISGGDRYLDVHHRTPFRLFGGDWEKANQLENLICLCRNCHAKVEWGKLECPA